MHEFYWMGLQHCFIVPGLNNSGPEHWQTSWEKEHGFPRIEQKDWDTPVCEDWIHTIDSFITTYPLEEVILIGHSLGCVTIAHWANKFGRKIRGALLVAPSDVDAPSYPPGTTGFAPMPNNSLPFSSIVITSDNDPYVSIERAVYFAKHWNSKFINIGSHGHINSASNLGNWSQGYDILQTLINQP